LAADRWRLKWPYNATLGLNFHHSSVRFNPRFFA
jgi:hypothetical protein